MKRFLLTFFAAMFVSAHLWAVSEGPWTLNGTRYIQCSRTENLSIAWNNMWDTWSLSDATISSKNDGDGTGYSVSGRPMGKLSVFSLFSHSESVPSYARVTLTWNYQVKSHADNLAQWVCAAANTNQNTLKSAAYDFSTDHSSGAGEPYNIGLVGSGKGDLFSNTLSRTFEFDNRSSSSAQTKYYYLLLIHHIFSIPVRPIITNQWGVIKNSSYSLSTDYRVIITYNANGGSGTMDNSTIDGTAALRVNSFTRTGYTFNGWNTNSGGTGTNYANQANLTATSSYKGPQTLYAKWTAKTYTVTFDKQSGTGGSNSVTATYDAAMPSMTKPTRAHYVFGGYYTAANGGGTQYYTASGGSARNWNLTQATTLYAKWTAAPTATVSAPTAKSLTYTGDEQELINAGSSNDGTIQYKLGDSSWSTSIPTAINAGNYTVYYRVVADDNHTDNAGSSVSVTINPAPLSCTADNKSVTYGDAAPTYTATYSGWVNSETQAVLTGSLAFACDYSAGSDVDDYTITPSGVSATNYDITFHTGTLTVNKATASITSAPSPVSDLTYDGAEHSLVSAGSVSAGTMKYSLDDSDYSTTIPTASAIGTHRVYYMLDGGQNYTSVSGSLYVETTIAGPRVADNADPSTTLSALYAEAGPMSLLMNRTIYADGDYNTICLPFDVTESDFANPSHPLYGYERLKSFRGAQVSGSGQNLSIDVFVQDATEIIAGVPYLITYPSNHGDIVDAVFNNVLITATEPGNVSANGVTFQGMFAPVHITSYEDNTTHDYLFLGTNNQLNWPTNDGTSMRGFRAYFIIDRQVITPSMAPRNSRARIVEHTDTTTDMETVTGNPSPVTQKLIENGQLIIIKNGVRYNAQGQLIK